MKGLSEKERQLINALVFAQKYTESKIMKSDKYTADDWYNNVVRTVEQISGKCITELMGDKNAL